MPRRRRDPGPDPAIGPTNPACSDELTPRARLVLAGFRDQFLEMAAQIDAALADRVPAPARPAPVEPDRGTLTDLLVRLLRAESLTLGQIRKRLNVETYRVRQVLTARSDYFRQTVQGTTFVWTLTPDGHTHFRCLQETS